jgi:hypothetical protein
MGGPEAHVPRGGGPAFRSFFKKTKVVAFDSKNCSPEVGARLWDLSERLSGLK